MITALIMMIRPMGMLRFGAAAGLLATGAAGTAATGGVGVSRMRRVKSLGPAFAALPAAPPSADNGVDSAALNIGGGSTEGSDDAGGMANGDSRRRVAAGGIADGADPKFGAGKASGRDRPNSAPVAPPMDEGAFAGKTLGASGGALDCGGVCLNGSIGDGTEPCGEA